MIGVKRGPAGADDCHVSIDARCPSCQAAVPAGADWCSLCHRDLRPAPAPTSSTPQPVTSEAVAPEAPRRARGRHARPDNGQAVTHPVAASPARTSGRHASATLALLEDVEVPRPEDADSEEIDAYADVMLTRLAIADPAPRFADPGSFPGGRWGLAAASMVGVTLVLLAVGAVAGIVLG